MFPLFLDIWDFHLRKERISDFRLMRITLCTCWSQSKLHISVFSRRLFIGYFYRIIRITRVHRRFHINLVEVQVCLKMWVQIHYFSFIKLNQLTVQFRLTSARSYRGSMTSLSMVTSNKMSSCASLSCVSPQSFSIFLQQITEAVRYSLEDHQACLAVFVFI